MVWSCEKGNGGRSVEISGKNGRIREKESRKTKIEDSKFKQVTRTCIREYNIRSNISGRLVK